MTAAIISICGSFFSFIAYKGNHIGLYTLAILVFISVVLSALAFWVSGKKKKILLENERILIPATGSKLTIVNFEEIFGVKEIELQGVMNIRIERKQSPAVHIPSTQLETKDYYDLLDILEKKFPTPSTENPYYKNKKIFGYLILIGLPLIFFGFAFYKQGFNTESIQKILFVPLLAVGLTYIASIATKKISAYNRENKDRLNLEPWKTRRKNLNWSMGTLVVLFFGACFSILPFRSAESLYVSPNFIYFGLSVTILISVIFDRILDLEKFVSLWERGLYYITLIFFGMMLFLLVTPEISYRLKTPEDELIKETTLRQDVDDKMCFIVNEDDILGSVYFCKTTKNNISPKDKIIYKTLQSKIGLNLYFDFKIKK